METTPINQDGYGYSVVLLVDMGYKKILYWDGADSTVIDAQNQGMTHYSFV